MFFWCFLEVHECSIRLKVALFIFLYCSFESFLFYQKIVHWWVLLVSNITLFRMGLFRAAHGLCVCVCGGRGWKGYLPKIYHWYPKMMKLGTIIPYLNWKRSTKYINHVTDLLTSADISIFSPKISTFAISRNTDIDRVLTNNFKFF